MSASALHAAAPHPDGMTIGCSWEGCALSNPPTGRGDGETRVPHPPARGLRPLKPSHRAGRWGNPGAPSPCARAAPSPSRGRGNGETRFPHGHVRRSCAWRTTPDAHGPGTRASRPRHGSAGTVTTPSLTLLRWGREPGASPQRGEAGTGAERGERWSPQPSVPPGGTPPNENGGMWKPGFPIFMSAVHAAPPHHAAMNIRLFLGGLRPPKPSQGPGPGCAGLRPASAEVWGNLVSPHSWGLCSRQARFHCIVAYRLWGNQGTLTGTVMVAV